MEYCVAIRTLGTAGQKYQTLLDSLNNQTIKPKKILVYISEGYPIPNETIGCEEYIYCPKGMITQRSLSFDEIDTEFILFCDDDLYLPENFVEKMYEGLCENDGDCISPDIFEVQEQTKVGRLKTALSAYVFPRKNDGWAFRIMRNGSYTYNVKPAKDVIPTESAAGACMLIKKEAFRCIHFEDERWMENFSFPLGDDLLFFFKLHFMKYKVFVFYNSGVRHLDAGTGSSRFMNDRIKNNAALSVVIPYRIKYDLKGVSPFSKAIIILSCFMRCAEQLSFLTIKHLIKDKKIVAFHYLKGLQKGLKYIKSERYRSIPKYDAYI